MENRQKWVNLFYLAGAVLFGYIVYLILIRTVGFLELEAKVRNLDLWITIGSVALASLFFALLYSNDRSNQFMNEVVAELSRVTRPTVNDTQKMTVAVIIMVFIAGLALGGLDFVWTHLVTYTLTTIPKFLGGLI